MWCQHFSAAKTVGGTGAGRPERAVRALLGSAAADSALRQPGQKFSPGTRPGPGKGRTTGGHIECGNGPYGAQAEEDALLRAEADGGARQPPRWRVARASLHSPRPALARPHCIHRSLHVDHAMSLSTHCRRSGMCTVIAARPSHREALPGSGSFRMLHGRQHADRRCASERSQKPLIEQRGWTACPACCRSKPPAQCLHAEDGRVNDREQKVSSAGSPRGQRRCGARAAGARRAGRSGPPGPPLPMVPRGPPVPPRPRWGSPNPERKAAKPSRLTLASHRSHVRRCTLFEPPEG